MSKVTSANEPCNDAFSGMKKKYFNCNHVIALDPIRIWTHYAPQNDRLNLSFVKDVHEVGKKMARNGHKMAVYES